MKIVASLFLLFALIRACTIFSTRFDAQGNPWVRLPGGVALTSQRECSLVLTAFIPGYRADNTRDVYALTGNYLVVVEDQAHTAGDVDYYEMPKTEAEAADQARFQQHTRQFFLATGGLRINTATLHDTKSRLLSSIDRNIDIVADQAGRSGIPNVHGASCYLNTAIQLLYIIPTLRHQLAAAVAQFNLPAGSLSYQMNAIFFALENGRQPTRMMMHNVIASLALRHSGVIAGNRVEQFDSAEVIKYLVMDMEAEIQPHLAHGRRWYFRDLLYTSHDRLDHDHDQPGALAVEDSLDAIGLDLFKVDGALLTSGAPISIEKLIKDTYADAPHGEGHTHSHRINDLPAYMFVKFPRFGDNGRVTNSITMPLVLNLDNRVHGNVAPNFYDYELIGVGLHSGGNYNGGHYTALVRGSDGVWRTMDDSSVSPSGAAAPQGPTYSSKHATCALYRRILRAPEKYTNMELPARPGLDLNTLLANTAAPPSMNGYSGSSGGRNTGGSSSGGGGGGSSSGGGSGGSGSKKNYRDSPTPSPAPVVTPRRIPASATALSVSSFVLGTTAALIILLA